jgi:hypothetical protein
MFVAGDAYKRGLEAFYRGDYVAAAEEYRFAAEKEHSEAQHHLGYMYFRGEGVQQDYVQAYMWLTVAAAGSERSAEENRDLEVSPKMTPAQIAAAQKLAREWIKKHSAESQRGPEEKRDLEMSPKMTAAQIATAQKLAREWIEKNSADADLVVIDRRGMPAYIVFTGVPKTIPKYRRDEMTMNLSKLKLTMISKDTFKKDLPSYAQTLILRNDYPKFRVLDGIICLVERVPGGPWGLTWNGGIAFTKRDYFYAKETYRLYREDPAKFPRQADPRADPVNPGGHLPAFGCL